MNQYLLQTNYNSKSKLHNKHYIYNCLYPIHMSKMQEEFIRHLHSKYAAMILESELNQVRLQLQEAAKEDFRQTEKVVLQLQQ